MRSLPMSAILVKMPPQMRSTVAPRLSPMAKPMKLAPTSSDGMNIMIPIMKNNSTLTKSMPIDMPDCSGIAKVFRASPRRLANAVRLLARVLIRIPNHATL